MNLQEEKKLLYIYTHVKARVRVSVCARARIRDGEKEKDTQTHFKLNNKALLFKTISSTCMSPLIITSSRRLSMF